MNEKDLKIIRYLAGAAEALSHITAECLNFLGLDFKMIQRWGVFFQVAVG